MAGCRVTDEARNRRPDHSGLIEPVGSPALGPVGGMDGGGVEAVDRR